MIGEPRRDLEAGERHPYDASDEWNHSIDRPPLPAKDWAHAAARGIVVDLCDRGKIKHGFENIDEDVRIDIIEKMTAIILLAHSNGA